MMRSVVAIGGGHGLALVLEGLVGRCDSITGVVSVADDGGSSGRLRRDLDIVAPGDLRRCLAALAPQGAARDAVEHRFDSGVLSGHPTGNVLLASLLTQTGDPVVAADTFGAMIGARGRVLPATSIPIDLLAHAERGVVKGQVAISEGGGIDSLSFSPEDPPVPDEVVAAIGQADLIVLGPGSLYSSVLAPLVPAVVAALAERTGKLVYVANLVPEVGETDGYVVDDHIDAVISHGVEPDVVLADQQSPSEGRHADRLMSCELKEMGDSVHDPARLVAALASVSS